MSSDLTLPGNGSGVRFGIARWQVWAPGVTSEADWMYWLANGSPPGAELRPAVDFLPAMLRRRLDRIGRIALQTAWPCATGIDDFDFVYGSRHGSLHRTVGLLVDLATKEPLSPAAFSLAVHNNIAGLFSIARGNRARATAMAAGPDTLAMTLLEGATMVTEGVPYVLVTFAEDSAPEVYEPLIQTPAAHPFSVSLLLTADAPLQCTFASASKVPSADDAPEKTVIRFLHGMTDEALVGVDQHWQLERASG